MARTQDDIQKSMQQSIANVDPTIDTNKGPVLETAIIPWSKEFQTTEGQVEHLGELYQLENASLWSDDEIEFLARQFGLPFGTGEFSQGFLTFFALERPKTDIVIPLGTLGATDDATYMFQTIEEATVYAATASAFYNANTRRYEIKIASQATVAGTDSDIKQGRIRLMLSNIPGITGVINDEDFSGGASQQNRDDFVQSLRELPLGNSLGTPGGLIGVVVKLASNIITDVAIVSPANIGTFERLSDTGLRAAFDVYVLGTRLGVAQQSYVTMGTETQVVLVNTPVANVTSVLVNGTPKTFTVVPDVNPTTRGSTLAQDKVVLGSDFTPGPGQSVLVSYSYNRLIADLQSSLEALPMFDTTTLVRYGKPVPVTVDVSVNPISVGTSTSDIEQAIADFFKDPINSGSTQKFIGDVILDSQLTGRLEQDLGVSISKYNLFNRPDTASSPVQSITFDLNEYPNPVTVTVRA